MLPTDCALKWNMSPVPGVPQTALDRAKQSTLVAALRSKTELCVSIVHRSIAAQKKRYGDAHQFGASTVLQAVGKALEERDATALFLLDRFPSTKQAAAYDFLSGHMAHGLGKPGDLLALSRNTGFGFTSSDTTRIGSALDISLGGFTRCLNDPEELHLDKIGTLAVRLLAESPTGHVWERGLIVRPLEFRIREYAEAYIRMLSRLQKLGVKGLGVPRLEPTPLWGAGKLRIRP